MKRVAFLGFIGVLLAVPAAGSQLSPGQAPPAERTLSRAQALAEAAVPHPYDAQLRKIVLSTLGRGTPWGAFRDPEDGRRYVGADACRPCHYDRSAGWSRTKMASALTKLADFSGGRFLNDPRCLSCHTTGYDPGRANGGFDEGAGVMADVQCEACHGAGSLMVERPDRRFIIRNTSADLCGRCHSERYGTGLCFPEYDEWKVSRHARSLETLRGSAAAADTCLECHSADAVAPGGREVTLASAGTGVTCQACHDAMTRTFPDLPDNNQLRLPKSELCAWCHSERIPGADGLPHAPQAELFGGRGGAEFPGEEYRSGAMNADLVQGCPGCHATSDRSIPNPYQGHAFLPNILACRRCHPDLKTFDRKAVQTGIRRLLLELEARLAAGPPAGPRGENYRRARYNYYFVLRDRSLGIHNTDYARKLLTDSLRYLGQVSSPPSP